MLRFLTAGESHGRALSGILEGFPEGVKISREFIDGELSRRQSGFGRGKRMGIEKDKARIVSGLRDSKTLGSPISFYIENKDNTINTFSKDTLEVLNIPRPAHADFAGVLKYEVKDVRNILERASARETACRVVIGAFCKQLLNIFDIDIISSVAGLGKVSCPRKDMSIKEIKQALKGSSLGCVDRKKEKLMMNEIKSAEREGDTLGGLVDITVEGVPPGLGSFMHWDKRLSAKLSFALMSIPAVKGVEIGRGFEYAVMSGRKSHDGIYYKKGKGFYFKTNNSGGILGGISSGQPITLRIAMKPISTLRHSLDSVDFLTGKKAKAPVIRSDTTAVTACGVVAESMTAFVLADAFLEKFSSDTLARIKLNYKNYLKGIKY